MRVAVNIHDIDPEQYDALPLVEQDGSNVGAPTARWKTITTPTLMLTIFRPHPCVETKEVAAA